VIYYLIQGIFMIVHGIFSLFWLLMSTLLREMVKFLVEIIDSRGNMENTILLCEFK
jgi:uncharacterized membrane protein HdeD (DUF308 family)